MTPVIDLELILFYSYLRPASKHSFLQLSSSTIMGGTFSSNALSGGATDGVPSISYAYASGNTVLLGADASYTYDGQYFGTTFGPTGEIVSLHGHSSSSRPSRAVETCAVEQS